MDATIAKLDKVVKTYNKHHVLNEISMSINKGELLGLIGPSGSGKNNNNKVFTRYGKSRFGICRNFRS